MDPFSALNRMITSLSRKLTSRRVQFAQRLNNLAVLHQARGHYRKAEALYLQALSLQNSLAADDLDLAQTLSNLANLYAVQRRYSEAEPFHMQALDLYERLLGPDHYCTEAARQELSSSAIRRMQGYFLNQEVS
ncbi:tetratricopeptide repeat protein [Leptolyngbya sp. FACHB-261]|uniref:tetratricopeptide repeat protein n=1 Tax=Leptolyngbya sp. FACHB-261 TaxID=2692806 RepID=UPI001688B116|nr:tetratricopeptide repeat protein [Leptolyngbya sp. FACHB-261]MBD2101791.1 tetratricopeptide repeat protein [Leptolyngbya sp. FACHB-261]